MTTPVTCTIIAMNEADRIARTIRSVQGLVAEVLVVDSGSTDGTQALAASLGARVVHNPWTGFGPQKRFAEDAARHDWILNLDADEWLTPALQAELAALLAFGELPARSFKMKMTMVYPHRDTPAPFADYHNYVRLYDRRATRFAESTVHDEVPPTPDARQLQAPALHQSFRSLSHLVRKELAYYDLQKRALKKGKAGLALRIPFELPFQFFKFYIIRHHVFGGAYGLVLSLVVAFMRWMRLLIFFGW